MKRIRVSSREPLEEPLSTPAENVEEFPEDCERLVGLFARNGYEVSLEQVAEVWAKRSGDWFAQWLTISDCSDEELWTEMAEWWEAAE